MNSKGIQLTGTESSTSANTRVGSYSTIAKTRLSQFNDIVNESVLDNIVSRFSFVNDHHVRGRWRTGLSVSVVAVPMLIFAVAMWYQVLETCVSSTTTFPILTSGSYSTEDTIRNFLMQDPIHYCAAARSFLEINSDNTVSTQWSVCNIQNHKVSGSTYCANYKNLANDINAVIGNGTVEMCFDDMDLTSLNSVAVFYTQCMATTTALVNSIQAASYSIAITILLYLIARVLVKYGVVGLMSPSKWLQMLNNNKKNELWKTQDIEASN